MSDQENKEKHGDFYAKWLKSPEFIEQWLSQPIEPYEQIQITVNGETIETDDYARFTYERLLEITGRPHGSIIRYGYNGDMSHLLTEGRFIDVRSGAVIQVESESLD